MNRNNLARFCIVLLVLIWSAYEIYPQRRATSWKCSANGRIRDTNFNAIVQEAQQLSAKSPDRAYETCGPRSGRTTSPGASLLPR
jgi:hypothetical protein